MNQGIDPPETAIIPRHDITALVLAGGQGSRLGGRDKGLVEINGRPLIAHITHALQGQVGAILISANRNIQQYQSLGYPVLRDRIGGRDDHQGPLAGVLTGLQHTSTDYLLTLPCDAPQVPPQLVQKLAASASPDHIAVAHDGQQLQSVYALIPVSMADSLQRYLASGQRKMRQWLSQQGMVSVDFSADAAAFGNINTPEDLRKFTG